MSEKGKIMKNIINLNVTFLVTIILVIGASYYVLKYVNPEDPFKLEVNGGFESPVSFTNEVDEQLKVCTYDVKDRVQEIQLACWTFSKGRTIKWEDAPPLFLLKVFKPAALDQPLITKNDVEHMSTITISKM